MEGNDKMNYESIKSHLDKLHREYFSLFFEGDLTVAQISRRKKVSETSVERILSNILTITARNCDIKLFKALERTYHNKEWR